MPKKAITQDLYRLPKLGIKDCFRVPGDCAFPLDCAIASNNPWSGNSAHCSA